MYFRDSMIDSGLLTRIGYWHDRKGENEIDIIAADELSNSVTFYEVKRQQKDLDLSVLMGKVQVFLSSTHQFKRFNVEYRGLSIEEM